ncbi:hypothetical protein PP488_gp41 [Gordonia phage Agueybana]|uniref:Uncharacterized protein n=1 Tax=Gordonia phage Agueybana TaxID=2859634 RepID=A0AC61N9N9_9CAUD|nr:hypothetical protein PP488_gp41 [Gordonia phage Agueybana]QYC54599.1 hypothetical protein SEA_AGUEYBANA_41 [Gordonia phage Agueybana]
MTIYLPDHAAGASLRWSKRSIERRFGDERDDWDDEPRLLIGFGVNHHAVDKAEDAETDETYHVEFHVDFELADPDITIELICSVRFRFRAVNAVSDDEVRDFLRDYGLEYTLGFIRAAVADQTRLVGMPTAMLPVKSPSWDEIESTIFPENSHAQKP